MTPLKQNSEHVRTNLKVLETLTYNCTDPDELDKLATKLDSLIKDFRAVLPRTCRRVNSSTTSSKGCKKAGKQGQTQVPQSDHEAKMRTC